MNPYPGTAQLYSPEAMTEVTEQVVSNRRTVKSAAAFRTISEVAEELDLAQHVLRFWESKFSQIKPLKRGGGRRYYRPEDIELLLTIRGLLYKDGYTIKGVQKLLREGVVKGPGRNGHGNARPTDGHHGSEKAQTKKTMAKAKAPDGGHDGNMDPAKKREIQSVIDELTQLRDILKGIEA